MRSVRIAEHDAQIRYHELPGDGPPLVFVHGLGSASSFAFPQIAAHPRLRRHRSILVDLLGFGYSDRPPTFSYTMDDHAKILCRLLDALGVAEPTVVGHSMGGAIAILVAKARQDQVSRLILAEGNLDPQPGIVSGGVARQAESQYVDEGHAAFARKMLDAGFEGYSRTVEAASPLAMHRSAVDLIADRSPTFREILYSLPIPRHFLISEESKTDPDVERLPRQGVSVAVVPRCGHDMMADNPEGFAEAIANAID